MASNERVNATNKLESYFFINDYRAVLWALSIISKNEGKNTIVITSKEIKKFLEYFKNNNKDVEFSILYSDFDPTGLYKKKSYTIPLNLLKAKKFFNNNLKNVKDSNIYFFGVFNILLFYSFIQKLSNRNRLFYCESPQQLKGILYEKNSNNKILRLITKILFNLDVYFKKFGDTVYPYLTHKFFENNDIEIKKDFSLNNNIFSFMNSMDSDVLILVDDLVKFGYCYKESFIDDMNELLRIIKSEGLTYSIKPHPYNKNLYGDMKNDENILTEFIPANCFLSLNNWKYVIGLITTTLFDSQEQTKSKIICVIDCIKWVDNNFKKEIKEWLSSNNERMIFPKNWNGFKKILSMDNMKIFK